jgi:trimethylamine:corrinoid methyltransferase-like protein
VDDDALAVEEILAAGPGGSHLARPYTRRHVRDAWQASLMDQTAYGRWADAGATTLGQRLRTRVAELLSSPRPFELAAEARAHLDDVLARAEAIERSSS